MKNSKKNATKCVSLIESTERKLTKTTFINEAEKPVINQEQLQEFDRKLKKAVMNNLDVEITYYVDNSFQTILSQVKSRDTETGFIYVVIVEETVMPLTHFMAVILNVCRTNDDTINNRVVMTDVLTLWETD